MSIFKKKIILKSALNVMTQFKIAFNALKILNAKNAIYIIYFPLIIQNVVINALVNNLLVMFKFILNII